MVVSAMLSGALDYLEWPFDLSRLDLAFRRMDAEGELLQGRTHRRFAATIKVRKLTRRERDVLIHLARGLANKQIADTLRISYRTVEIHRANLMHKLNAQTAADAARIALYAGLDEDY
jgi:FixJ family two-component response regulator